MKHGTEISLQSILTVALQWCHTMRVQYNQYLQLHCDTQQHSDTLHAHSNT